MNPASPLIAAREKEGRRKWTGEPVRDTTSSSHIHNLTLFRSKQTRTGLDAALVAYGARALRGMPLLPTLRYANNPVDSGKESTQKGKTGG